MPRPPRRSRGPLAAFTLMLVAAITIAAITVAAAGGGEDVADVAPDDPGERRGPTEAGRSQEVTVATPTQLLPLAKRTAELVEPPPGISVRLQTTAGGAALAALCSGQVEIAFAERKLSRGQRRTCRENGLGPTARLVGHQTVAVYASERLGLECLTFSDLRGLFRPGSTVERYSQLDSTLPALPVRLLAPPSGWSAFELFTREVLGAEGRMRRDVRVVRDTADFEHVLDEAPAAVGVYGAGLLGFDDLALDTVAVDAGDGCVAPRAGAVRAGRYPLAEPLYAYTTRSALRREAVARYFNTVVERAPELAGYPGVVPP